MRALTVIAIVAWAATSGSAIAQTITCESNGGARSECEMNTRGVVRLVEQLSKAPCREGTDWGLSKHTVWVDNGCRAIFKNEGMDENHQPPATGESANRVTCESIGNGRNECEMNTRGVVKLVEQLSHSPCREGTDWGLSKHTVWVENGCRAVFANQGSGGSPSRPSTGSGGSGGLPTFNAECPGNLSVHGDQGGYIFLNGDPATVKKVNDDYYEATDAADRTTVSIGKNPDGSLSIMYSTRSGANGVCQIE